MSTALDLAWFYVCWALVALGALVLMGAFLPASSHGWYDPECCSGRDCAPVEEEWLGEKDGQQGRWMRTKVGTVFVPSTFPRRKPSKDWSTHVCIGWNLEEGGAYPRCVYEGGGV